MFVGPGLIISLTFVLACVSRHWNLPFLPKNSFHLAILSSLFILPVAMFREPFDIGIGGDLWIKSIFDYISWIATCTLTPWALRRIVKWWRE